MPAVFVQEFRIVSVLTTQINILRTYMAPEHLRMACREVRLKERFSRLRKQIQLLLLTAGLMILAVPAVAITSWIGIHSPIMRAIV